MINRWKTLAFLVFLALLISCGHRNSQKYLSEEKQAEYITKGKQIVQSSFQALSGELKDALTEGGVQNAVGYCHLKASPIVDSLSALNQVRISRTSSKFRNAANQPDPLDLTVIEGYEKQAANGEILQPHLELAGDKVIFYAPILIQNPMCLLCHGEPGNTMEQANADFIRSKYPNDLATGYRLDDFRGVWKIEFIQ